MNPSEITAGCASVPEVPPENKYGVVNNLAQLAATIALFSSTMQTTKKTAIEVCTILDSLSALSQDLACHRGAPRDALVLTAGKTQDACLAIEEAVTALKEILALAEAAGGGPIPPMVTDRLDEAGAA
jgi:hypothetical protein